MTILAALLVLSSLIQFAARNRIPSLLTIQGPASGWSKVLIDGQDVTNHTRIVRVSPIVYGPHQMRIVLTNGKTLWLTFFHADIGVERQLELFIDDAPTKGSVRVRFIAVRFEGALLTRTTHAVLSEIVNPDATSESKPLDLDGL